MKRKHRLLRIAVYCLIAITCITLYAFISFKQSAAEIEKEWSNYKAPIIRDFGSTESLAILPLVNWHANDPSLKTEAGVSYLIKTDTQTILFDVGFNKHKESPSPIEHNMNALGISLDDIDTIFLSHAHLDHNGGQQWVDQNTFSLGLEQTDLSDKRIYAVSPTHYPNNTVEVIPEPSVIAPGVASLGAISRQLAIGRIEEQALVINVKGKGLVVIVGCGHQTVPKLITRTQDVFGESIYGLIGDLHYPIPTGRLNLLGINLQKFLASGEGPHSPVTFDTMVRDLKMLQENKLQVIGLGAHDTSDEAIDYFKSRFSDAYHPVLVGEWIRLSE
mgnify:CR=1 FL=1